eukprot:1146578-Pelagomonas_calceolata.AAC.4
MVACQPCQQGIGKMLQKGSSSAFPLELVRGRQATWNVASSKGSKLQRLKGVNARPRFLKKNSRVQTKNAIRNFQLLIHLSTCSAGVIVLEGHADDVQYYTARLRALPWAAMQWVEAVPRDDAFFHLVEIRRYGLRKNTAADKEEPICRRGYNAMTKTLGTTQVLSSSEGKGRVTFSQAVRASTLSGSQQMPRPKVSTCWQHGRMMQELLALRPRPKVSTCWQHMAG